MVKPDLGEHAEQDILRPQDICSIFSSAQSAFDHRNVNSLIREKLVGGSCKDLECRRADALVETAVAEMSLNRQKSLCINNTSIDCDAVPSVDEVR